MLEAMSFTVSDTDIQGLVIVEPKVFGDDRGFFFESYNKQKFADIGLDYEFVQDNHSLSSVKVLRGIHYQDMTAPLGKLVRCTAGAILDVGVDLRVGSPTFGHWVGVELSSETRRQLILPVGFGHAFATLSESAEVQYKSTGNYEPAAEGTIAWDDPDIGIEWPFDDPVLSEKDKSGMSLKQYLEEPAFRSEPK